MARIIPNVFSADTVSVGERHFFEVLREQLDDEFWVIHSIPWLSVQNRHIKQGECDFLILHAAFGVLSIEVKPGDVLVDTRSGNWRRSDGSDLGKDPYLQAQRSAHALNHFLGQNVRGWADARFPHGYAVHFSDADQLLGRLPPHAMPLLTLLRSDLNHLQERIRNILRHFGPPLERPVRSLIEKAIDRLRPEFQLIRVFSADLEDQQAGLQRLTDQQMRVLNQMQENNRLLIKGCAGSGKTLLAYEKASRIAQTGQPVLLLCFNIPLANWLRNRAEQEQRPIDVFHFHGLCEVAAKQAGLEFRVPDDSSQLSDFYDRHAPDLFARAVSTGAVRKYDAVIVDEGQDFIADWWYGIEELLKCPRTGIMYIFYDPEQNIFRRDFGFLVDEARLTLNSNCRNTRQISAYVSQLSSTPFDTADFAVDGLEPEQKVVRSDAEEVQAVDSIIRELVQDKRVSPDRIMLIGRRRLQNSPFAACSRLGGVSLVDESVDQNSQNAVRYSTVYRFKGLEADCVILTGFHRPPASDQASAELYCAASRAKLLLYAIFRSD